MVNMCIDFHVKGQGRSSYLFNIPPASQTLPKENLWILVIGQIQSTFLSKILFLIRYLLPSFHHQKPMVNYTLLLFP